MQLEALPGWVWDLREAAWEDGFSRLLQYVEREGHARVPTFHKEKGFSLGGWVRNVRSNFAAGRLSPEQRKRLEALPGWVWRADAPSKC